MNTRGFRLAAGLLIVGLLVEVATLFFGGPESFMAFAGLGALLVAVGIVLYLLAVLRAGSAGESSGG
ncbi:MAG: hypothetical protein AAGD38_23990 [Acidobacteriota bacterium]